MIFDVQSYLLKLASPSRSCPPDSPVLIFSLFREENCPPLLVVWPHRSRLRRSLNGPAYRIIDYFEFSWKMYKNPQWLCRSEVHRCIKKVNLSRAEVLSLLSGGRISRTCGAPSTARYTARRCRDHCIARSADVLSTFAVYYVIEKQAEAGVEPGKRDIVGELRSHVTCRLGFRTTMINSSALTPQ